MSKKSSSNRGEPSHKANWRVIFGFCARYWWRERARLLVVFSLLILMVAAEVAIPIFAGRLIDALTALAKNPAPVLVTAGFWAVGLLSLASALHFFFDNTSARVYNRVAAASMAKVLDDGFTRIQEFSADWHANTFAGSTVHKLTRGRWSYEHISNILLLQFLPLSLVICGLAGIMLVRFPIVGVVFIAMVGFYVIVSFMLATLYVRPANVMVAQADSRIGGGVADAVSNNAAVRAFGAEAREVNIMKSITSLWHDRALISWGRSQDLALIQHGIWLLLQSAMLVLLIGLSARGAATPGDVAFVITANFQLGGSLRKVGDHIRLLQRASAELGDLIEFDQAPLGVDDVPDAPNFVPKGGAITFDKVRFAYPATAHSGPALYDQFDLEIKPGERIGLVGPSGSGKSTFVKLIQRLYDVNDGTIFIDGQAITSVRQTSLRQAISIVPQDPALFHRSLGDNIAYGRPGARLSDIIEAAKRANAHDFIAKLPNGYDTLVGERGVKLSGGERQRVAIARAFLANAPIVIFDEATSSLDTITELQIQAAMNELMRGRTTIIIAHRLSTIKDVDRILVFDQGRIVEQGHHLALIARPNGAYARLHVYQDTLRAVG
jgi:ATP-binding cassette, subfamily B, bacterial